MKILLTVFLVAVASLAPCSGAVVYQLTGTSGVIAPPFAENFQATTASFIVADTTIPVANLDSCTTGLDACTQIVFEPVSSHDASSSSIEFFTVSGSTLYFFASGVFGGTGVFNTTFGAGSGVLTVTTVAAVPEPATVTFVFGAALGLAALRRFRT